MDLCADLSHDLQLGPLQRTLIPTGIAIALPSGFEAQIRPRSGLALKEGLTLINSPERSMRTTGVKSSLSPSIWAQTQSLFGRDRESRR